MFFIRFGIFLGLIVMLFGCQELFDNKQKTQTTSPPPTTTPTPPKENPITFAGLMNIKDTGTYKFMLAASTGCVLSGVSIGVGTRCSAWEGQPLVTLAFNQNLDKVEKLEFTPRGSKMGLRNQAGRSIALEPRNPGVSSINDGDGWEVKFIGGQGINQFEIRVRCEDCDLKNKEFDEIDIYFGSDLNKMLGVVPSVILQKDNTTSLIHQKTFTTLASVSKKIDSDLLSFPLGN